MATKLTSVEKDRIATLLREGKSQGSIARETGRSRGTINSLARKLDIPSPFASSATKKMRDERRAFAREGRLDLSDEFFTKVEKMLRECDKAKDLRDIAVSYGILVEKRLLEEGHATVRTQVLGREGSKSAVEKLKHFLDGGDLEVRLANGDGEADQDTG